MEAMSQNKTIRFFLLGIWICDTLFLMSSEPWTCNIRTGGNVYFNHMHNKTVKTRPNLKMRQSSEIGDEE